MTRKLLIAIFISCISFIKISACVNGAYLELADASFLYQDPIRNIPYGHELDKSELEATLLKMDSLYKATKEVGYLSDKGLVLIFLGRYEEAIKIYQEITVFHPGRYSTAANLGTAYELIGQNEKALTWIKRAVAIDSNSHHGSEWIHVNILEAKIRGEQYNSSFLLRTDFGKDLVPYSDYNDKKLTDLFNALYYQLNERITFVKPKDPLVAALLFDLGNIAFLLNNFGDAIKIYQLAKIYGLKDKLVDERIIEAAKYRKLGIILDRTKKPAKPRPTKSFYGYIGAIVVLLLLGSIILYLKRRKGKLYS